MVKFTDNRIVKRGRDEQARKGLALSLRKYRISRNISQESLAKLIGTSVFSVSRWERAKHYPPETTIKLMKLLGVL